MVKARLAYIDALRGFAILGVILTHAGQLAEAQGPLRGLTNFGGYGVQLFYVISAFTIFLTYEQARKREQAPVRNFFIRRLMRIVPVYWLGIVLYTAVYGLGSRGWKDGPELWHYPLHLTLTNVLHPLTTSSVVPGGWSISIEVLFYLTVPLWFMMVRSLRGAIVFTAVSLVVGQLLIAGLKPLVAPLFPDISLVQYWYRSFPSQLPCFGFGMILFYFVKDGVLTRPFQFRWLNLALLLVAAAPSALVLANIHLLPRHYLASVSFVLIALALSQIPWRLAVNPLTVFMGRISYSAYLLHFLVLKQTSLLIPQGQMSPPSYFMLLAAAGVVGTIPLAYLSHRFVEVGFTDLGKRWIARLERSAAPAVEPAASNAAVNP